MLKCARSSPSCIHTSMQPATHADMFLHGNLAILHAAWRCHSHSYSAQLDVAVCAWRAHAWSSKMPVSMRMRTARCSSCIQHQIEARTAFSLHAACTATPAETLHKLVCLLAEACGIKRVSAGATNLGGCCALGCLQATAHLSGMCRYPPVLPRAKDGEYCPRGDWAPRQRPAGYHLLPGGRAGPAHAWDSSKLFITSATVLCE